MKEKYYLFANLFPSSSHNQIHFSLHLNEKKNKKKTLNGEETLRMD